MESYIYAMALNPEKINFFLRRIAESNYTTFKGSCAQLFNYLQQEVKDNPVYDKLETQSAQWEAWPVMNPEQSFVSQGEIPGDFDSAKALAYAKYKQVTATGDISIWLFDITGEGDMENAMYSVNRMLLEYLEEAMNDIVNANPEVTDKIVHKSKGDTVFIIHSHDEALKDAVQLFLQVAGVHYVVLHQLPDKGRNIIDKLIQEGEAANYAIALLSPDDDLASGKRARQNVILEIGYFLGRLGKERVRMLVKGDVEIPSDLLGILFQKYTADSHWKSKMTQELQAVGIQVNMDAILKRI